MDWLPEDKGKRSISRRYKSDIDNVALVSVTLFTYLEKLGKLFSELSTIPKNDSRRTYSTKNLGLDRINVGILISYPIVRICAFLGFYGGPKGESQPEKGHSSSSLAALPPPRENYISSPPRADPAWYIFRE
ncbi:hypothetical protein FOPE_07723 [Fonsecaea pedrosoi]|nr:hypothetical protein FOPE_07723 [Fonsecaea pedrosoi]